MKKEQSLQHLIVTEMPYELLKLLIEEKALSAFVRNLIKDTEVNSLSNPNYNKTRRIANLIASFPLFGVKQTKVTIFGMIYTRKCS